MLLESPEEHRHAGAAANADNLWSAQTVAVAVNRVDKAIVLVLGRHKRGKERGIELPYREHDQAYREADEHGAAGEAGQELEGEVIDPGGEGVANVDLAEDVAEAEAHHGDAEQHQQEPALDVHPEVKPLDEISAAQRSHGVPDK